VRNEEVLHTVKEERNILYIIENRKASWIGHTFRKNCLLKYVTEGKIEVMERQRRRHKQLADVLKEMRRYWNLKQEVLDHILWRTPFGQGCVPVIRQTTE
jgi:hypothetical protein